MRMVCNWFTFVISVSPFGFSMNGNRAIIRNRIENCTSCREMLSSMKAGSVGCDPKFAFACIAVKRNAFVQHLTEARQAIN